MPYLALYGAVFAAIGVVQPFLPSFLAARGLSAEQIALALALGSGVRLVAGPAAGRWADRLADPRLLLGLMALVGAAAASGFLVVAGFLGFLAAQLLLNAASAPLVPLADTLTLAAARDGRFDYGQVRAGGSVAYILAAILAGWLAGQFGFGVVPWLIAGLLLATLLAAGLLPKPATTGPRRGAGGFRATLRLPGFARLLLLSGLIQSSHAAYYGFGSIHWAAAGHSASTIGLLWAEGVVGEVALFFLGSRLVGRIGPRGLALLAAGSGVLRWSILSCTAWLPALVATQWLHAFTFGAQHLAAMHLLLRLVPASQTGTAQSLHAALGVGLMTGAMTLACGPLYRNFGGGMFWVMALLCALAIPLALSLKIPAETQR
ncbi:MFS transporter [Roseomonas sp. 18066]|uniref:MFS transporter n=1 Tax=Roseomonas sp. 18066 TaxID=2681412 RepID=UPI00135C6AA0|nr:MFS transporter [Roseomonas sp. 18066]